MPFKVDVNIQKGGVAAGMPILTETLTKNAVHIGGRMVHRRNGQYLVAFNKTRAIYNVNLTLAALRTALFAMQKIIETRLPILFFEPRPEYAPSVRRLASTWRQLYAVKGWPAGTLTNKNAMTERNNITNVFKKSYHPVASFLFSTRGLQANTLINECRLLEIPVFGLVNTAQHQPNVTYPIPYNDVSGSSHSLLVGTLQGMMVRADVLQKRRLFNAILTKARLYRSLRGDMYVRKETMVDENNKRRK